MKNQSGVLWGFVLLASLGLIVVLMIGHKAAATPPITETAPPLPTETPWSLAAAPTRLPPRIAELPSATPLIFSAPLTADSSAAMLAQPTAQMLELPPALDLAQIAIPPPASPGSMFINFCASFGTPLSLTIFDWSTNVTTNLSDAEIAQIPLGWDATGSLWQGYASPHPFNQPDDARARWKMDLYLPDGTDRWIIVYESPSTPNTYYIYGFVNTTPFADANGQHFGTHPCRAFALPSSQVTAFLGVVSQYQTMIPYPPFISGTDPRWKRGTARPVAAYADLRSIPSATNNNPIGGIDNAVPVWFALDPSWDGWAQVKLGSVQGWVETRAVDLTVDG